MKVIRIENLSKEFKMGSSTVYALDDVNLTLSGNQMIALRGPSGCGKSTLLNLLGSLDRPSQGVIEINGINVTSLKGKEEVDYRSQKIGVIFQAFNLVPYLTAIENVILPMEFSSKPLEDRKKHAKELLLKVGIDESRHHHRPSRLSGGQQQRVAIARALVNEPDLLLADEPTANLDSKNGEQVLNLLVELASNGQTVIVSTHDEKVASHANTIVDIRDGKIINESN